MNAAGPDVQPEAVLNAMQLAGLLDETGGCVAFSFAWLQQTLVGQAVDDQAGLPIGGHWGDRLIIGMTGNIAMGKSTVLAMLAALGAHVIDADSLVHQLREPGAAGYESLVALLGRDVLSVDGTVNRSVLAAMAFQDKQVLFELEKIFRPLVVAEVERLSRASTSRVVVVEAIKLLEGELKDRVDSVWVVDAPLAQQVERLMDTRGLSQEQALARIHAQRPQADKLAQADVVIRNDGDLNRAWQQVQSAWSDVLARLAMAGWLDEHLLEVFLSESLARVAADLPTQIIRRLLVTLAQAMTDREALPVEQAVALLSAKDS